MGILIAKISFHKIKNNDKKVLSFVIAMLYVAITIIIIATSNLKCVDCNIIKSYNFNMDIKARIEYFLDLKGMNKNQVAKAADINPSTINCIFTRNNEPTLATLELICKGLGITMSQFFAEDEDAKDLSDWEKELLLIARTIPENMKSLALRILKDVK